MVAMQRRKGGNMNEATLRQFFVTLPDYLAAMLEASWQTCSLCAIQGQRQAGRGFVLLTFDLSIQRMIVQYWSREDLHDPMIKALFPDQVFLDLKKGTRLYNPRIEFCQLVSDPLANMFYTISPVPFTPGLSPKMSNQEIEAAQRLLPV